MKRRSTCQEIPREKMDGANLQWTNMEAVSELRTQQNNVFQEIILSRLRRNPTVTGEAILEQSCIGRVQSNLNLGGNTDFSSP